MIYIIAVLLIIVTFLITRLFYVERGVESITKQLIDINENKRDKKLTIGLLSKRIEALAEEINRIIQVKKQSKANKIKSENDLRQTIANMSHDLRTPLTSIIGYIQFLKLDNISEDEKKEYLDIAELRAKSLECLLNDFYELSLIESLDYELDLQKININKILQEVMLSKYADFMNREIRVNIKIPKENIYIVAEEKSLERVIENLLSNTLKYAKDTVDICLKVENNMVLLRISNIAKDLTLDDAKHIFDRFYMADKTRSDKGTGLGLAIVKGLVQKMNGNITADIIDKTLNIYCKFQIIKS
ncbi:HAMP domain-containing histidine kinase [Clostridium sp. FP2]|uniref:sensor histidine kinase n=1 Tax=Clostridium TaxID=1485 RepID=UPI0013E99885|nr:MULTISPECIES: HAMP domain-containing sensor histidine kinase [Clostridium]MBW9157614.1 HAMP domain-containing histidine kinase [Clostridium tagluense]MBZ9622695.1 HAMP domain-containing histidine kinase [Clostridium sp. FP2]MCB2296385.1 HAMP domain-containing histidine kinase [Clostridium tagluense]WLC66978.1 HAMP domain-containing histidine kinase [Clostridium tagluense]